MATLKMLNDVSGGLLRTPAASSFLGEAKKKFQVSVNFQSLCLEGSQSRFPLAFCFIRRFRELNQKHKVNHVQGRLDREGRRSLQDLEKAMDGN